MEFLFLKIVFKLSKKYVPICKLKYSKFEQDPLNIKDFMAQNIIFCLPEVVIPVWLEKINYIILSSE